MIIAHDSGGAKGWKTRAREENSRPFSRTTEFTLADPRATQQTRQSIVQCNASFRGSILQLKNINNLIVLINKIIYSKER